MPSPNTLPAYRAGAPSFPIEKGNRHQARDIDAEQDNQDGADAPDDVLKLKEGLAEESEQRPHRHEDDGKSPDKRQGVKHRRLPDPLQVVLFEIFERYSGDKGQVAGQKWQNAGGGEADDPSPEGHQEVYILVHVVSLIFLRTPCFRWALGLTPRSRPCGGPDEKWGTCTVDLKWVNGQSPSAYLPV